ncbi:MAG: hypothetical protein JSV49_05385, partial [Thermoplasmata archaeon]
QFQELCGKSVAFVPFSNFWGELYASSDQLDEIASYGAVPMLRIMPWGEPYYDSHGFQYDFSMDKIINGLYDLFLMDWAEELKDFGKPVFVTMGPEMNGNWYAWSGVYQGGGALDGYGDPTKEDGPEKYVDAFRHIIDLFESNGVDNAVWYWQPNYESTPEKIWNVIEAYYPGDDYIDWVAFSLFGAQTEEEEWVSFDKVMEPIYNELSSKYADKPLMLAEWGIGEI